MLMDLKKLGSKFTLVYSISYVLISVTSFSCTTYFFYLPLCSGHLLVVESRGERLLKTLIWIGQEVHLGSSCPIRMSKQTINIALIG